MGSQACKAKKRCFTGLISSATILRCEADAAMCKYTADESGVFSGENECVAKDKEEFYNYPCKNGTECFITAEEEPPTESKIKNTCKEAKECFNGPISGTDVETCAENSPAICQYNPDEQGSFKGEANCVEKEFYNYPCKNGTVCFIAAAEALPTEQQIKDTCKKAQACKETKKCFKGDISSTAILKCEADAAICKYTPDGSGSFTGENDCVAEEDSYNYPCKNGTVCFIAAAEALPTAKQIK